MADEHQRLDEAAPTPAVKPGDILPTEREDLRRKLAEPIVEDGVDWRERGESFGRLGDLLLDSGKLAEAAQAYQHATDAIGKIEPADPRAQYFAGKVVSSVRELWKRPGERLDLLLAKLDNERRELGARG